MSSLDGTFDTKTEVAFIWSIEDVKGIPSGVNLTDEQARQVLANFERHHDGSYQAMWEDLEYHIDNFKEEQNA